MTGFFSMSGAGRGAPDAGRGQRVVPVPVVPVVPVPVVPVVPAPGVVVVPDGTLPGVAGGAGAGSVGMVDDGVGGVAGASSFLPHATRANDASREAASRDFFMTVFLEICEAHARPGLHGPRHGFMAVKVSPNKDITASLSAGFRGKRHTGWKCVPRQQVL
jgi:hypothetical protein